MSPTGRGEDAMEDLQTEKKKSGAGKYIAVGCLSVVIVVLIGLAAGGLYVASNWKTWAADGTTAIMTGVIRDTELSADDKRALIARVDLIGEEFKNEAISWEELEGVIQTLVESPILTVAILDGLHMAYFDLSTLTDEEKQQAERITDRLARGLYEERIQMEELEPVLDPISESGAASITITRNGEGTTTGMQLNLKNPEDVTEDELRAFMAAAESLLEQKAIEDEPFDVDVVEEFDKAVEAALGRRIAPAKGS